MQTIAQFQSKVAPKLHGTTLAKLSGSFYDKMYEAAGVFLGVVKPYSVIRRQRITNAIYDHVYNYTCADDLEEGSLIDIRPIGTRSTEDSLTGTFSQEFDIRKGLDTAAIEYVNGQKTLRLSKELTPRTVLFECDSLTIGATVTAGGDASNLDIDYLDYVSGGSSISFDLSGATGQGTITFALSQTIDISDLEDLGALFHWLKFPLSTALTSVRLRVGSDASNYKEVTVTAAHDRAWESDAWMLLRYALSGATTTGTPDFDAIDYVQVAINYTAGTARNGVHLDNITAALGEAWEVVYYGNRLFTDSTGTTWKEIPTASTDLIQLSGAQANTAYLYQFMLGLQQELKGKDMAADFAFFRKMLGNGEPGDGGLYLKLKDMNPDQAIIRQSTYYDFDSLDGA